MNRTVELSLEERIGLQLIASHLEREHGDADAFEIQLRLVPRDPWLHVAAKPAENYPGVLPDQIDFAIWRHTGAAHLVVGGEVQDPELGPGPLKTETIAPRKKPPGQKPEG